MSTQNSQQLRLRAQDAEDLAPLSTFMQDAIIAAQDMYYDAPARRFALAANRYRWEVHNKRSGLLRLRARPSRVRSMVRFDFVDQVHARGLERSSDVPLNLLAITSQPQGDAFRIVVHFSHGTDIALTCETIDVTLDDVSAPWTASRAPRHDP